MEMLKEAPNVVYHFTRTKNIQSIINDRQLKKFKDSYVFVCTSLESILEVYRNTILSPSAHFLDFDGLVKPYSTRNTGDYVVLKLETRHSDPMKWFYSNSSRNETVDSYSLAYKGNLPVKVLEIIDIKEGK